MILLLRTALAHFLRLSLIACLPIAGLAQVDQPVVGFTDHSLISGYPEAEIVDRSLQRDVNHRIVLGGLERVRGEVIPEASERLRGDVTRITYEVSQEFTGEDVYQFYRDLLNSEDFELLFNCEGRACGSSNYWANDIFRNRILYGPERNQYYMAFRANPSLENSPYFSIYIITRVNRSIYAYVVVVEPGGTEDPIQIPVVAEPQPVTETAGAEANADLLQALREQGSVELPAINFQSDDRLPSEANIEPIVAVLNADESLRVYLVAHLSQRGQALDVLMRRSAARASALRQALIAAGIAAERIESAGAGPLAPRCRGGNCEERVELVLR